MYLVAICVSRFPQRKTTICVLHAPRRESPHGAGRGSPDLSPSGQPPLRRPATDPTLGTRSAPTSAEPGPRSAPVRARQARPEVRPSATLGRSSARFGVHLALGIQPDVHSKILDAQSVTCGCPPFVRLFMPLFPRILQAPH